MILIDIYINALVYYNPLYYQEDAICITENYYVKYIFRYSRCLFLPIQYHQCYFKLNIKMSNETEMFRVYKKTKIT